MEMAGEEAEITMVFFRFEKKSSPWTQAMEADHAKCVLILFMDGTGCVYAGRQLGTVLADGRGLGFRRSA